MQGQMKLFASRQQWAVCALGGLVVGALGAWFADALHWRQATSSEVQRGRGIYVNGLDNVEPIQARMARQPNTLPALAVRCINCHDRSGAGAEFRAQVLSRENLLAQMPRRGGPATRFDAVSMCKLLSTGIDPAWIVINQTMPRYELSESQCRALWAYLESEQP